MNPASATNLGSEKSFLVFFTSLASLDDATGPFFSLYGRRRAPPRATAPLPAGARTSASDTAELAPAAAAASAALPASSADAFPAPGSSASEEETSVAEASWSNWLGPAALGRAWRSSAA